jgi:dTMP kinase
MMDYRGALIVLEGPEGVGKSTQVRGLVERFGRTGTPCVAVREPGGTPLGDAIRGLLLDPNWNVGPQTEALLFMASRGQLVREVIRPAMAAGSIVVADRFFLSTYAYQIAGRRLPEEEVRSANRLATGGLVPDLTILLHLPAREGMRRAAARGQRDRMEESGTDFHDGVSAAFAEFATPSWQANHPECGAIVPVDASGQVSEVAARIGAAVDARLARTPGGLAGSHP